MLEEETRGLSVEHPKVKAARHLLFGSWEMNWMAYNVGDDLQLANSTIDVPYLMYPVAKTDQWMLDSLDPPAFRYQISSMRVSQ